MLDRWDSSDQTGSWQEYQPGHPPVINLRYDEPTVPLAIIEADEAAFPLGTSSNADREGEGDLSIVERWVATRHASWVEVSSHDGGRTIILKGRPPFWGALFLARLRRAGTGWALDYPSGKTSSYTWSELLMGPGEGLAISYANISVAMAIVWSETAGCFVLRPDE